MVIAELVKYEARFPFETELRSNDSDYAIIWVYKFPNSNHNVLIIQQPPSKTYRGLSVTNGMEHLLSRLHDEGYYIHEQTAVYEHYPQNAYLSSYRSETFDRVFPITMDNGRIISVEWIPHTREDVELLLGCPACV